MPAKQKQVSETYMEFIYFEPACALEVALCLRDMTQIVHGLLAVGQFAVGQFTVKKNASFGYIRLS